MWKYVFKYDMDVPSKKVWYGCLVVQTCLLHAKIESWWFFIGNDVRMHSFKPMWLLSRLYGVDKYDKMLSCGGSKGK